jgi:hypothetical protein
MAVELATAYVSLVPSARGLTQGIRKELGGLDSVGDDAGKKAGDGFSSGFSGILKGGLLAAGAVGAAAVLKGFSDAIGNEAANDKLAAQLGLDGPESERLGGIAGKLYGDAYGDSLATVNEAIKGVMQQGLVPADATNAQIESVTAKVLDLSTAFEQDLGKTSAAVGTLLKTGMATDATEALDIITRGFQTGVDKQEDYLDTLTEYSTLFRNLGIDGATATGILSQGLQAGARDADKVADSLKEFSIRAVDGSELTAESFERLGIAGEEMADKIAKGGPDAADALQETLDALRDVEDPVERAQIAVGLFGAQAEDLGDALYAIDPKSAVDALGDVGGAAEKMGDTLNDNAAAKIESFKREALQKLSDFVADTVIPNLEKFSTWAQENPDKVKLVAAAIAGPLVLAFAAWAVSAGAAAIATVAATWPILLAVAAVAALAAGLVWAYQNVDWFRNAVQTAAAFITDTMLPALSNLRTWFAEKVLPVLQVVAAFIAREVIASLAVLWGYIDQTVIPKLKDLWATFDNDIIPTLRDFKVTVDESVLPALGSIVNAVSVSLPVLGSLATFMNGRFPGSFKVAAAVIGFVAGILSTSLAGAGRIAAGALDVLRTSMDGARRIAGFLVEAIKPIITLAGTTASAVGAVMSAGFRNLTASIELARDAAKAVGDAIQRIKDLAGSIPKIALPFVGGAGIFGGLFAKGGRPPLGKVSIVGEKGPELFVPDTAGTIIPNNMISVGAQVPIDMPAAAAPGGARAGVTFTGPVYLQDEVDIDMLERKMSFAQMAGAL